MALFLRLLKRLGLAFLVLLVIYAVGRPTQIWLDGFYSGERGPYLQMPSATSMTIRWQSEKDFVGVVKYGASVNSLNQLQREEGENEEHEVRLTNLKPATKYYYSIGDGKDINIKGNDFWFKTAPDINGATKNTAETNIQQDVRFWITGDQGYPNKIQNQVRDAMLGWLEQNPRSGKESAPLDLWLTTGDNAYRSGSNKQFQAGFFEPYNTILRNTPVWPVYGNHDARRWVFFDLFTFPTRAESGGLASGSEHYYSFDYANIHFVILDTQENDLSVDGEMLNWLKKDLKQTKQQWFITLFHHPPYTKGSHNSDSTYDSGGRLIEVRENIVPVLEAAGVDLVFSGHSHMYERSDLINCHYGDSSTFNKNMQRSNTKNNIYNKNEKGISAFSGTIYTVIGSSSKVDEGPLNHPALPHSYKEAGSMIFDVNENKLKAYFINSSGKVSDRFEIIKGVEDGVTTKRCK
ncbi:MAG: metallophosphoesterase family protein [Gammaproteobacteria bacterium]|nr:metallophosphoesterase family protein [Gammaproteobacteria bacterium]